MSHDIIEETMKQSHDLQELDNFVQEWQRDEGSHLQNKIKALVGEYRYISRNRNPELTKPSHISANYTIGANCFSESNRVQERINASGLVAESSFQYAVLALHAFMLDEGFEAVIDIKNARVGYHPVCKGMYWID